jgi:predicted RNA-binding protein with PUA-like domain
MAGQHWLVKSEPLTYPWQALVRDKRTMWEGVRNFEARNNLRAMKTGDLLLFYHSGEDKAVVGIARVKKEAYADPTAPEEDWSVVDVEPLKPLKEPVTLDQIKSDPNFSDFVLLKRSRLSVVPVTPDQFQNVLRLGKTKL